MTPSLSFNFSDNLTESDFSKRGEQISTALSKGNLTPSLQNEVVRIRDTLATRIKCFQENTILLTMPRGQNDLANLAYEANRITVTETGITVDPIGLLAIYQLNLGKTRDPSMSMEEIRRKATEQTLSSVFDAYRSKKPQPPAPQPAANPPKPQPPIHMPTPQPDLPKTPAKKSPVVTEEAPKESPVVVKADDVIVNILGNPEPETTSASSNEGEEVKASKEKTPVKEITREEVSVKLEKPQVKPKRKSSFLGGLASFIGKIFAWLFGLFFGKKKANTEKTGEQAV